MLKRTGNFKLYNLYISEIEIPDEEALLAICAEVGKNTVPHQMNEAISVYWPH